MLFFAFPERALCGAILFFSLHKTIVVLEKICSKYRWIESRTKKKLTGPPPPDLRREDGIDPFLL